MAELVRGDGLPLVQQVTQDLHRELGSRRHVYCGAGAVQSIIPAPEPKEADQYQKILWSICYRIQNDCIFYYNDW